MPKSGRPSRVSKALQVDNQPQKRKLTSPAAGTSKKIIASIVIFLIKIGLKLILFIIYLVF
jgi:hypothetical protein